MAETFPRYFTHVDGFANDTAYVRCDAEDSSVIVLRTGKTLNLYWSLWTCVRHANEGEWREITADEASVLIDGRSVSDATQ